MYISILLFLCVKFRMGAREQLGVSVSAKVSECVGAARADISCITCMA